MTDENKTKEQLIAELEESRKNETIYRQIFQNMTTGCALHELICNEQGKPINYLFLKLNPAFEKITGVPCSELLGKTLLEVMPDTEKYWIDTCGKVALTGEPAAYENYSKQLGKVFETWIFSPQKNQFAVIFSDITKRKRIEEELRESRELLKLFIEKVPVSLAMFDLDMRYIAVSHKWMTDYSLGNQDIIGHSHYEIFPEISEAWKNIHRRCLAGESANAEEDFFKRMDGAEVWTRWQIIPWKFGDGSIGGIIMFTEDITNRKRNEDALREAEEKYRNIIENSLEGFFRTTSDGQILMVNPSFAKMFGYDSPQEMINTIKDITQVHINSEQRAEVLQLLKEQGVVKGFEAQAVRKDGSLFWVSANVRAVPDKVGNLLFLEGNLEDITRRKELEGQILQAQKLESLGILAGGIAHDFNNIVTAILGNISLAKSLDESKEQLIKRLTAAEKASLRASDLAQQLLTFSKGGAPIRRLVSIQRVIEQSVQFSLSGSNIESQIVFQEGLWPVEVDEGQISQVIQNLIINAQQAMPEGGRIRIEVKNQSIEENAFQGIALRKGDYLLIVIKDQGAGISKNHLSKIFDPYFTTKQKGSGLGLSISYSIIQRHHGYITAESNPGTGTTFFIYLPASSGMAMPQEKTEVEAITRGKGKILVMDDEESVLQIAKDVLKNLGYEVNLAKNGTEAVKMYKNARDSGQSYDVVITDLTVPGDIGGVETLRILKEINNQVKVIVSSGYSNDPAMSNFKAFGFSDILRKPYRAFDVSETMKRVLKCRRLDD